MDSSITIFEHGVENLLRNDQINADAAQDAQNFVTQDGVTKLVGGRINVGAEGALGQIGELVLGYKANGNQVLFRKRSTTIEYFNGTTWVPIISNLTAGADYVIRQYNSISGTYMFAMGVDGIFKFNIANPTSYLSLYDKTRNFLGRFLIDKARMLVWDLIGYNLAKTTLKLSWIDNVAGASPSAQYVTNEILATGNGTLKTFSGTLGFKVTDQKANAFGIQINAPTGSAANISTLAISGSTVTVQTATPHGLVVGDTVLFQGMPATITATGTITTNGSTSVVGSGTQFTTQLVVGSKVYINSGVFIVVSITDNTHMTVSVNGQANSYGPGSSTSVPFSIFNTSEINNNGYLVTGVADSTHFTVNIGINAITPYALGGTATKSEVFTDNRMGVLSTLAGATGTIDYVSGNYTITTINAVVNAQTVLATYAWEDSNFGGITDFTYSVNRVSGQGNSINQDIDGDPIMEVVIGDDGSYYSMKQQSAYNLSISADDLTFTNNVYRRNLGLPSKRAAITIEAGIVFMNCSNPEKPEFTILKRSGIASVVEPATLFPNFKFSNYDYSDCYFDTYERFVTVDCKVQGSLHNDTILFCNVETGSVDIVSYASRCHANDNLGNFYIGSPFTDSVYQIMSGFDDMTLPISAYWTSAATKYGALGSRQLKWRLIQEELKKFRRLRIGGYIDPNQKIQVYANYDEAGNELIGTILGSGSYVDYSDSQAIGSNFIGQAQVGGDNITNAYRYFIEIKPTHMPKFKKRSITMIPIGIGYFDFNFLSDWDIVLFENRIPKRFRQKQYVSLDGTKTNQPTP